MARLEYIPIPLRYLEAFQKAEPSAVGSAVVAALQYATEGAVSDQLDSSGILFWVLKGDIDRVQDSLDETSERQREKALKRWNAEDAAALTAMPEDAEDAAGCYGMPRDAAGCYGMPRDAAGCYGMPRDAAAAINQNKPKKQSKKNNSNSGSNGAGRSAARRIKAYEAPSVEEVRAYCAEIGCTVDPQYFHDYYDGLNWHIAGTPIHDWKAILRTWAARDKRGGQQDRQASSQTDTSFDTDEFFAAAVRRTYAEFEDQEEQT